jgi:hypothetical protein
MRSRQAPPLLTLVAIALLLSAPAALATTWYVDCAGTAAAESGVDPNLPFRAIGAALRNAKSGDTVLVQGRQSCDYPERIFIGSGVRVMGLPDEAQLPPRITGTRQGSTVEIASTDPNTLLEGFWVTGGQSVSGGGIAISGSPTVRGNIVSGNLAVGSLDFAEGARGGGIAVAGDALIEDNEIWGNTAVSGRGGGVAVLGGSPVVTRNTIHGNSALAASDGFYGYGGGISVFPSAIGPSITSNIIRGNRSDRSGGGINVYFNAGTIAGNTIVGNQAGLPNLQGTGGGLHVIGNSSDGSSLFIMNNIVMENRSTVRTGGVELSRTNVIFRGNNIFNNHPTNLLDNSIIGTLGNVSIDPNLPPGTLAPDDGFPHIDTGRGPILCVGDPNDPGCLSPTGETVVRTLDYGTLDIFGRPRLLDGNRDGIPRVDVGAAEYAPGSPGDVDDDGVPDASDDCPAVFDPGQQDLDADGVGDACDNCPPDPNSPAASANADQADLDLDAVGDACDADVDNDVVRENAVGGATPCVGGKTVDCDDNCPGVTNPSQADADKDGVGDSCDQCATLYNPSQGDDDADEIGNACDNCPSVPNGNCLAAVDVCDINGDGVLSAIEQSLGFQVDANDDDTGDACEPDLDGDGIACAVRDPDALQRCLNPCTGGATTGCGDNCLADANADQADADIDGAGDVCDVCPDLADPDQTDTDRDGTGDPCDVDSDNDTVPDDGSGNGVPGDAPCPGPDPNTPSAGCDDNCPLVSNSLQTDTDGDGSGNACDDDIDGDGILPDGDDSGSDTDNRCSGPSDPDYPLCDDNCPLALNVDQSDADADLVGDACDNCPAPNSFQDDRDRDGLGDPCDPDLDGDGVPEDGDPPDNCPTIYNITQVDADADGLGDGCDSCPSGAGSGNQDGDLLDDACDPDDDNDTVPDTKDNCPLVPNPSQTDTDRDRMGDACDADADGDGVPESTSPFDNCPLAGNAGQEDQDSDNAGDACDNCPLLAGAGFTDSDRDGAGDPCDNCDGVSNRDQADTDGDGTGDACDRCPLAAGPDDADADTDGVPDLCDNCATSRNPDQKDVDEDGIGNACDLETLRVERLVVAGGGRSGLVYAVTLRNRREVPVTVLYTVAVRDAQGTIVFETVPALVIPAHGTVRDTFMPPPGRHGVVRTLIVDIVVQGETNHSRLTKKLRTGL